METIDQNGVEVIMLTPQEVMARIDAGTAHVVDVREPHEHEEVRIAGSALAPLSTFDASRIDLPDGKELILHCRSARRCGIVAEHLIAAGFAPQIHRMAGGMIAWQAENLPVETGPKE
ncbi:MAG: rhodanese-like domain-containing protein [Alphaproteobacteria bacterium]|nr:rhodanese-like domain-containing protein [Alphaproteobacteria bacterium]